MTEYPHRLLVQVTPPASEPLTLAEAKLYLRVDGSAEDALITDLIAAAREHAEQALHKSLMTQSWKLVFDGSAPLCTPLPRGPVSAITSVTLLDEEANQTVLDSSAYALSGAQDMLVFDSAPSSHRIEIIYVAGYGDAEDIPRPIVQGIRMHLASMYERRESGMPMPVESQMLYRPFAGIRL